VWERLDREVNAPWVHVLVIVVVLLDIACAKTGQRLVKDGSKTGQRLVKDWSKTGQRLVKNGQRRVKDRSNTVQRRVKDW
jgi:gas vesicle protein